MDAESSKKIDEIIFETNDKINAIVEEIRTIRFSKMDEKEKEKSNFFIIKNEEELEKQLKDSEEIYKIIIDLNFNKFDIFKTMTKIKKRNIYLIGYLSHVQVDLKRKAERYCDLVLPRSQFSERLPELLS